MSKGHFINGDWQTATTGKEFVSKDPVYGKTLWQGAEADTNVVDNAVTAAKNAYVTWVATTFSERLSIIEKFKAELEQNKDSLAFALAEETGKPLWESKTEIAGMIGKLGASLKAYDERTGEKTVAMPGAEAVLRHRPHGVIAVFGPFNFPGHLPNGHIIPALLAGNTIVFKPSEQTPRFAELTLESWIKAGLPQGVINLVQGMQQTGMALAAHPDLNGLFFTGSSKVGKLIHKQFGGQPEKILALEMGGNNPLIVHEVNDAKAASYHTVQSAYLTAGQRCVCARRLIVPVGKAGDDFIAELTNMIQQIKVGAYDADEQPFMGSVISNKVAKQILQAQGALVKQGGKALIKSKLLQDNTGLLSPGLIDVTAIKERSDEEIFGPILQIIRVKDFNAAIIEANNTSYGLSAGIFTDNKELYLQYLNQSRAGILNWNRQTTGASGALPFGGIGQSGNHRPSAYYAADYCAYPVASVEAKECVMPENLTPGVTVAG